jgi:anaerobic ribonucleoside-triphosphate reductase
MHVEGMTERDVKKALLNFVYNLNVPSRWGQCVPASYRCLKSDGTWVNHENLQIGDEIYVVDMETGLLKKDTITHLNLFDAPKKMHRYGNKSNGFSFEVTPNHRVIYKTGSNNLKIKESAELLEYDMVGIPIAPWGKHTPESFMANEYDIQDELLELIAYIITDGTIVKQEGKQTRLSWFKSPRRFGIERFEELCDILNITYSRRKDESSKFEGSFVYEYRMNVSENTNKIVELLKGTKHEVPEFMQYLSPRQCYIILDAWVLMDGHFDGSRWKMQADNKKIQEMLAYLAIKAGKAVSLDERLIGTNKNATIYTHLHKRQFRSCVVSEVDASCEKVWCPTTETGTFVCMTDDGYVFLTGNSPFSNVTIDLKVPKNLESLAPMRGDQPYFVNAYETSIKEKYERDKKNRGMFGPGDSREIEFIDEVRRRLDDYESDEETLMYALTYKHFKPEMDIINRCFYQILCEGDVNGQPFTFPIPTINITEDFDWDNPNYYWVWENTAKYGSSYFQNFIGSQYLRDENGKLTIRDENAYSPDDVRSMCCRLQLDKKALRKRGGGLFGSDAQTGSVGVVTLNMARLGYTFKGDLDGLYGRVKELCDMAKSTLEKKRKFVTKMYDEGLYPYTRRYVRTFDTYFSTIGVNGMNEMVRNFTNDEYDITDMRGQKMCKDILDFINKLLLEYQEETGNLYNLEASPAEGTTRRLAKADQKRFPDIIQAGSEDAPYYTNSSQLPVDYTADPFAALDLQEDLQKKYTGGTVLHLYMNERISSAEVCKQLVKKVLSNYRIPYVSITPSFSVCPKHGYISGDHEFCPLCDKEILAAHAKEVDLNT